LQPWLILVQPVTGFRVASVHSICCGNSYYVEFLYGGIAMKLTLVLSDLRWLAELRDRQLLGRGGVQIPEIDKRKLLAMGLIEEKTGGLILTRKGRDAFARRG
jgi:hypothetical protein